MMRKKLVILGIISAFLLTSSILIASKVFAGDEGDSVSGKIAAGSGDNCLQGSSIDSELCATANQCLDQISSQSSQGGGVTSAGETWEFKYNHNMSQVCNETLFILSTIYLIDPIKDCKEVDTTSK